MSQISSTLQTPVVPALGNARRRLVPIAMIAFALVATALVAYQVRSIPANSNSNAAVDGWEAGITLQAAQSAITVAQGAQDGYIPGVMANNAPADAADGYLAGLLAARESGDAVDGFLPGLMAAHELGPVDDGWERGINLFPTPRSTVQDGWEAGLN